MPRYINPDICVNCGACEGQCPVVAIREEDDVRVIDEGLCIDCSACEAVCPVDAISEKQEITLFTKTKAELSS